MISNGMYAKASEMIALAALTNSLVRSGVGLRKRGDTSAPSTLNKKQQHKRKAKNTQAKQSRKQNRRK